MIELAGRCLKPFPIADYPAPPCELEAGHTGRDHCSRAPMVDEPDWQGTWIWDNDGHTCWTHESILHPLTIKGHRRRMELEYEEMKRRSRRDL